MLGVIARKQECGERDKAAIECHGGSREEGNPEETESKTSKKEVSWR